MTTSRRNRSNAEDRTSGGPAAGRQGPRGSPRGARGPAAARVAAVAALVTLAVLACLGLRFSMLPLMRGPTGFALTDTDCYMRWRLVERALAGEGVRIRHMPEDNAPYGRMNEWTAPMTILGVLAVRVTELVTGSGRDRSLEVASLWLGPAVGLVGLAVMGWLGWRAGGWPLALAWLVAWPVQADTVASTAAGDTDHHGLHQVLVIAIYGGCLAARRWPSRLAGAAIGLISALALWSAGTELLLMLAPVIALAVYELARGMPDGALVRFWRAWWVAGLVGTAAALLWEFWPRPFHRHLEFLSVWHVALWALFAALIEFLAACSRSPGWPGRRPRTSPANGPSQRQAWEPARPVRRGLVVAGAAVLVAAGAAVLAAGAVKGFDWRHLHVMQDERLRRQLVLTLQYEPFFAGGLSAGLMELWRNYGLLPLGLVAAAWSFRRVDTRSRFLFLSTALMAGLMLWQVRWGLFLAPLLVMSAGVALDALVGRRAGRVEPDRHSETARAHPQTRAPCPSAFEDTAPAQAELGRRARPWLAVAGMAVATIGPWTLAAENLRMARRIHWDPRRGPFAEILAYEAAAECLGKDENRPADGDERAKPADDDERAKPVVLLPWAQGAFLAGTGKVRVVGSPYWTNLDGLAATFELFTTPSDERFNALLAERHVEFILVPGFDALVTATAQSIFAVHGRHGTVAEARASALWRLLSDPRTQMVPCPAVRQLRPDWVIVRVPRDRLSSGRRPER